MLDRRPPTSTTPDLTEAVWPPPDWSPELIAAEAARDAALTDTDYDIMVRRFDRARIRAALDRYDAQLPLAAE
jgi:hypothetical protein